MYATERIKGLDNRGCTVHVRTSEVFKRPDYDIQIHTKALFMGIGYSLHGKQNSKKSMN